MREKGISDSGQAVPNDEVQFRDFRRTDIETCARISADAWPETANVAGSGDTVRTMTLYVEFYYYSATWLDVACVDGQVVGLLFGRIDREQGRIGKIRSRLGK